MKIKYLLLSAAALTFFMFVQASAQETSKPNAAYDAVLARKLGADGRGMKNYVLAILKTGPTVVPKGKERDELFKGHFANINRLANEGKLIVAGPFGDDTGDWRGLFLFDVATIEDAKKLTATDPVIKSGLMIAEFHKWYASAAMMQVLETHKKIAP